MSIRTEILDRTMQIIEDLGEWTNYYKRRVTYVNKEDFVKKFRVSSSDKSYKGIQMWQSARRSELQSFKNKVRHQRDITIVVLIGAKDDGDTITFNTLHDFLDKVGDALDTNLTLGGYVTDSEFCEINDVDLEPVVGFAVWAVQIEKRFYKDVIEGSIS